MREETHSQRIDTKRPNGKRNRREWKDHEIHHQKNRDPTNDSSDDEMVFEGNQLLTREAVRRRGKERDEEVAREAQRPYSRPTRASARPEQTTRNSQRHLPTKRMECGSTVQKTGEHASRQNRGQQGR